MKSILLLALLLILAFMTACKPIDNTQIAIDENLDTETDVVSQTSTVANPPTSDTPDPETTPDKLSEDDCPQAGAGAHQLVDADRGVCFLYPANFDANEYGDGIGYTLYISSLAENHESPVIWITFEPADGRSLEEVTNQRLADYAFPDTQSQAITLGQEPASMLDNLPGQDINRRVVAIHDDLVIDITIDHIGKNYGAAGEQAEAAYSMIIGSFRFIGIAP